MKIQDSVAFVSGANRGLGLAFVRELLGRGAKKVYAGARKVLTANGGAAIVNVLSDAAWFSRPMLAAYSATKSAAWSFTNALRLELRERDTQVLALHVGFMDTDMAKGLDITKTDPRQVAARARQVRA